MPEWRVDMCGRLGDAHGPMVRVVSDHGSPTVAALRGLIAAQWPALAEPIGSPRVRACIDGAMVDDAMLVPLGAQVAFFPPVSGG